MLASLPGEDVERGEALRAELEEFIYAVFPPSVSVRVGGILPREAALDHIEGCRDA